MPGLGCYKKAERRGQKADLGKRQNAEGRRQIWAKGKGQRAKGRTQKADMGRAKGKGDGTVKKYFCVLRSALCP
jgi:hypothetical protein